MLDDPLLERFPWLLAKLGITCLRWSTNWWSSDDHLHFSHPSPTVTMATHPAAAAGKAGVAPSIEVTPPELPPKIPAKPPPPMSLPLPPPPPEPSPRLPGRSQHSDSRTHERPHRHTDPGIDRAFNLMAQGLDRSHTDKVTVSAVTQEARRVLDLFVKRSLSHNDASPYQREQLMCMLTELDYIDECPYMMLQSNESYQLQQFPGPSQGYVPSSHAVLPGFSAYTGRTDPLCVDEPDYAEPITPDDFELTELDVEYERQHPCASHTHSVSSASSYGLSVGRPSSPPHRAHPTRVKRSSKGKAKRKPAKEKGLFDGSSSSSTEDYEYAPNELLTRKKKSFFKWASERLRQSFRRSKVVTEVQDELESPKDELAPLGVGAIPKVQKPTKKKKGGKFNFSLKRSASDKSKGTSSSTPNEGVMVSDKQALIKSRGLGALPAATNTGGTAVGVAEASGLSESDVALPPLPLTEESEPEAESRKAPRKNSPVPWKKHIIRIKKDDRERGFLDTILRPFRRGSSKLKHKGSKEGSAAHQRSRSADNLVLRPLSKEHEKLLARYVGSSQNKDGGESDSDHHTVHSFHEVVSHRVDGNSSHATARPSVVWYPPGPVEPPADGASRPDPTCARCVAVASSSSERLPQGPGQFEAQCPSCQHHVRVVKTPDGQVSAFHHVSQQHLSTASIHRKTDTESGPDDIDGLGLSLGFPTSSKPFHECTDREKEELYEKIAEQLAAIADQYNMESPKAASSSSSASPPAPSSPPEPPAAEPEPADPSSMANTDSHTSDENSLERELGLVLREKGDCAARSLPDPDPVVLELVRHASYGKFQQIVNDNIGSSPGWQQVAMMFRLTQTAVQLAGFSTAVALQIKEMTLKYFEDRFAGWIVGQGGWESMVEDNTESELD